MCTSIQAVFIVAMPWQLFILNLRDSKEPRTKRNKTLLIFQYVLTFLRCWAQRYWICTQNGCKDTKIFGHVQGKSVIFDISPQKKPASADLSVILIYSLFLFERQKEQASLLKHVSFLLTHLLACSFLCIKRNNLIRLCISFAHYFFV